MVHAGDITKLSGYSLAVPDVVTGGSPCQDLSIAGKREGLSGERSGLFMEQIRLIKELRDADASRGRTNDLIRPRFMVWENVVGALSSNKGEDFRVVLEETARIIEPDAVIPQPTGGKWRNAGAIMGNGWSVAWRVFDSKLWGVPQRRRRIALIADFGGQSAPEILFVRKGLSGDSTEGREAGERAAGDAERGVDTSGETIALPINTQVATRHMALGRGTGFGIGEDGDPAYTLQEAHSHAVAVGRNVWPDTVGSLVARADSSPCIDRGQPFVVAGFNGHKSVTGDICYNEERSPCMESNMPPNALVAGFLARGSAEARSIGFQEEESPTLRGSSGGDCAPSVLLAVHQSVSGEVRLGEVAYSLSTNANASGRNAPLIFENHSQDSRITGPLAVSPTVSKKWGTGGNNTPLVMAHGQANAEVLTDLSPTLNCNHEQPIVAGLDCRNGTENDELSATLQAKPGGGFSLNCTHPVRIGFLVRRLTPLECERLQGYPDYWTLLPQITEMSEATYNLWCYVLFEKARIDGRARWNAEREVFEVWREVEQESEDGEEVKKPKVWINTERPYKHKTPPQMLKWYNKMVNADNSDSSRYQSLGNSIALPPWKWVLKRISAQYERDATLGSLFDGLGGFPYLWEQINGKGSALWASEVEPFCIAVTECRINNNL